MEEERERKAALVQAKLQAKWWGKTNTEDVEEDEMESKDPRWKRRKPRKAKDRFASDPGMLQKGAWNKRRERMEKKQQKDMSGLSMDFLTKGKGGVRMAQWKKHMNRRESVEERDLFDLIAPVVYSQTEDEAAKAVEYEWAFEALDYAFHIGRSAKSWDAPKTPLRLAVQSGATPLVEALLKAQAHPDEKFGKLDVSVLHLAAWNGNTEVCQVLLEHDADPDILESEGQSPLFFAPSVEVCQMLYEYGADLFLTNSNQQSALHLACRAANSEVIEWLVYNGGYEYATGRDGYGATASFYAQQAGLAPRYLVKIGLR